MSNNPTDLKASGLKATLPRLKILEIFQNSTVRHLTAEDVYKTLLNENMNSVPYNTTYGVTVLTQPTSPAQTCTVTGGANGFGGGTMDDAAEAAGGVDNLVVTCVNN